MKKLGKYKYIILINFLIVTSYIIIQSTPNLFGIDDTLANTYIFSPESSFIDNLHSLFARVTTWNIRIGEILYFLVGCFPRYVYFFFNGLRFSLFFNLLYLYIYGKKSKEYLFKKEYILTILFSYIITITINPAFSETFIWMGATYNHIYDFIVILLAGLHFRFLYDGVNVFDNHKKLKIPYLIICFVAGFTLEHITPCLILYSLLILFYLMRKNKIKLKEYLSKNIFNISSIVTTSVGYVLMLIISINRISYFISEDWVFYSKEHMAEYVLENYSYILILVAILLLLVLFIKKNPKGLFENLKMSLLLFALAILSLIIIYVTPAYYSIRVTMLLYFSFLMILTYLFNELITEKRFLIVSILMIILIFIMTYRLVRFYNDFNSFNEIRYSYIEKQLSKGKTDVICPKYDNKLNYFFYRRLSTYEDMYCDKTYLRYLFKNDTIFSTPKKIKNIR